MATQVVVIAAPSVRRVALRLVPSDDPVGLMLHIEEILRTLDGDIEHIALVHTENFSDAGRDIDTSIAVERNIRPSCIIEQALHHEADK